MTLSSFILLALFVLISLFMPPAPGTSTSAHVDLEFLVLNNSSANSSASPDPNAHDQNAPDQNAPPTPSSSSTTKAPIWDIVESNPISLYPLKKFTVHSYPNPRDSFDHWHCHVDRPGFLCDPDSLLEKEDRLELQELLGHFPEWTKNPISPNRCVQKGVQLGIALAQFPLDEAGIRPLFGNPTHRQWRDWIQDGDARRLMDVVWQRLNAIEEDPRDLIGFRLAKDWGLVEGAHGCHLATLIMASAEPAQLHIYTHSSLPITANEKEAIIAEQQLFLRNPPREYPRALRAIVGLLRELIVHKQAILVGAKAMPIRKVKKTEEEENGGRSIDGRHPLQLPLLQWLALSVAMLFSLLSFILTVFLLVRVRRVDRKQCKTGNAPRNHCYSARGKKLETAEREKKTIEVI